MLMFFFLMGSPKLWAVNRKIMLMLTPRSSSNCKVYISWPYYMTVLQWSMATTLNLYTPLELRLVMSPEVVVGGKV